MNKISRRDFMKGAAYSVAGLGVASLLGGCSSNGASETAEYTFADTIKWDAEYDVVVLGMGFSGMVAALTASKEGASVVICEKMNEAKAGGNSKVCGQFFAYGYEDADNAIKYYTNLTGGRDVPADMIKVIASGVADMKNTLINKYEMDGNAFTDWTGLSIIKHMSPEYPEIDGSDKIALWSTNGYSVSDSYLFRHIKSLVEKNKDGIDVWYESPATELIQEPTTKAIIGVKVTRGGQTMNVRALNGVCVCTGGFEDDKEMIQTYLNMINYRPIGGLYNTGDGIKMCQKVGADLWHMNAYEGGFGLGGSTWNIPEGGNAINIQTLSQGVLNTGGLILVGTNGQRFLNESEIVRHGHLYEGNNIWENPKFPEKVWLIFDETQKKLIDEEGSIPEAYRNTVVECATVSEAAKYIGCDEATLKETINEYNYFAKTGKDYAHNREAQFMRPMEGKLYVCRMLEGLLNTQGGPKRNANAEVLDVTGTPIPHLYSAGEMGGITSLMYQGGTNVAECFIMGEIAGKNAAKAKEPLSTYSALPAVESTPTKLGEVTDLGGTEGEYEVGANQYIGTGTGMNGDVVVRVTMDGNKISNVEVLKHAETDGIGTPAIEKIPNAFNGLSTAEEIDGIDNISGSTITSKALKEAVKNALASVK